MLRSLRRTDGGPSVRARLLAALVAFAAFILAAPVILLPVLHAVLSALH